jgi:rhomboid protease GluP
VVGKILFVSPESLSPQVETFPLRGGRRPLTLHSSGFRHTASWMAGGEGFTGFDEITDLSLGKRGLRIGTRGNVLLLPRNLFLDRTAPERLSHALIERVGAMSDGNLQLARMAAVEQLAHRRTPRRATVVVIALCLIGYALELTLGPDFEFSGQFSTTFFQAGEYWRLLTANFLHGGVAHLLLNLLGLWVLGELVERPLGTNRTVLVMAASAAGAMGTAAAFGQEGVLGASGIVCGLAGAALTLELLVPERLPAAWRIPRRLFLLALALEALTSALVPIIAGAAHLGGFLGGALVAWLLTPPALATARTPVWLRACAAGVLLAVVVAGAVFVREIVGGPAVLARRAERLLAVPDVSPVLLNNAAWMIVTASAPTPDAIQVALRSAERAVAQTERADPNFLDTLAESQFLAGLSEEAIDTINEAIALTPGEEYFVEQRRRFTGERAYEDRPSPPSEGLDRQGPGEPGLDEPTPPHPSLPPGHPRIDEDPGINV